jgi:CRP-like cAMP-binding protein
VKRHHEPFPLLCRELQVEKASMNSEIEDHQMQRKLMQARLEEGLVRIQTAERRLQEAQAQLDRKRQKKREYKDAARKFRNLWQSVRWDAQGHVSDR